MVGKQPSEGIRCTACALVLLLAGQLTLIAIPPKDLDGAVWTNGQIQFTLNNWYSKTFVVESSPDLVNWTPVLTNTASSWQFPITVAAPDTMAFYRTVTYPGPYPLFAYALGVVGNINMNGNALITDSYNSANTNLSTNGQYDPTKTSTNGSLASVGGIVNIGNHIINGNVFLGPTATYTSGSGQVLGTIYNDYNVQFPDVLLPTNTWQTATEVSSGGKAPSYHYDFTSANNNGYYLITNLDNITVEAGVTVTLQVTTQFFDPTTNSITINGGITNAGTIIMYHNPPNPGGGFALPISTSGGAIGNRPANFIYFGLPGVTNISFGALSTFVGAIYAPEANLALSGGGSPPTGIQGSVIVGQTTDSGHFFFHFDESLLTNGPVGYHY